MHHVVIGGGPAATNAVETIRQFDQGASRITLVADEPAHSRMALPYWLAGKVPREHVLTADDTWFRTLGVEARIGVRARRIDPGAKSVALSDGSSLAFDNLLIATGASPTGLSVPGSELPGIGPLWTLAHTERVLEQAGAKPQPEVVLVGAGFIGFIVLNAMFKRGWRLAVVEREPHVLPRMLDRGAAALVENWLVGKEVAVRCGTTVQRFRETAEGRKVVELPDGSSLEADMVIVATGIRSNLELVSGSGIETDQGILVNDRMQTNFPFIYAAGDVAQGTVLEGDGRAIHAIQPTAVDHGRVAGANMAGQEVHYPGSLSMNVLDVCGLQCASFGNWSEPSAEAFTIANPSGFVYRKLVWRDDALIGAIFVGQANDLGMLNDVGMVKGILQTKTRLGPWKGFLRENPFDIRRPYVACRVAERLVGATLLGRPSRPRQYRYGNAEPTPARTESHAIYMGTKE